MTDSPATLKAQPARRDFSQLGVGGVLGLGLSDLVKLRASAAKAAGKPERGKTGKRHGDPKRGPKRQQSALQQSSSSS